MVPDVSMSLLALMVHFVPMVPEVSMLPKLIKAANTDPGVEIRKHVLCVQGHPCVEVRTHGPCV